MKRPSFLFFDIGNVLLYFDHHRAAENLARVAGVTADDVWQFAFASDLNNRCDAGEVSAAEFCRQFREHFACHASDEVLCHAASDIFELNPSMTGIAARLQRHGHRIGLLSNTSEIHIEWLLRSRSYSTVPFMFDVCVYSYRERLMKPDKNIFLRAAQQAGVAPHEVFYVDDIEGHVQGARAAGFDAVVYTTPVAYVSELQRRGISVGF